MTPFGLSNVLKRVNLAEPIPRIYKVTSSPDTFSEKKSSRQKSLQQVFIYYMYSFFLPGLFFKKIEVAYGKST